MEVDTTVIAPIIYKGYCPFCDQGFGMEEEDEFTYIMGNRCITCPTCGKSIIIPAFDDNNDGFLTQDENTLFPIFSNPNYFRKEASSNNQEVEEEV